MVNKYWRRWLRRIAPCQCQFCGQPSRRDLQLCRACQRDLLANSHCCPRCAEPMAAVSDAACGRCQKNPPPFQQVVAPWLYCHPLDDIVRQYKYQRRLDQLPVLTTLMAPAVRRSIRQHGRPDRLLPIPLHWRRLWQRGFNQAHLLALELSTSPPLRELRLRVDHRLCQRPRPTPPLEGLSRSERRGALRAAFKVRQPVSGEYLVIIDDVLTSGATSAALAAALLEQGAARVDVWCCARTPGPAS